MLRLLIALVVGCAALPAVEDLRCAPRDRGVYIQWVEPEDADIQDYGISVASHPSVKASSTSHEASLSGLDNYEEYNVSVVARNTSTALFGPAVWCLVTPEPPPRFLSRDLEGLFGGPVPEFRSLSDTQYAIELGHVNNDSHVDLLVGQPGLGLWLFLNNGTAMTNATQQYSLPNVAHYESIRPALGDINSDGLVDIVLMNPDARAQVFWQRAGGVFEPADPELIPSNVGIFVADGDLDLVDITDDGFVDLVVQTSGGDISFLEHSQNGDNPYPDGSQMDGDIENTASNLYEPPGQSESTPVPFVFSSASMCDLYLDGDQDFVGTQFVDMSAYRTNISLSPFDEYEFVELENTGKLDPLEWGTAAFTKYYSGSVPLAQAIDVDGYNTAGVTCEARFGIIATYLNRDPVWLAAVTHPDAPAAPEVAVGAGSMTVSWTPPGTGRWNEPHTGFTVVQLSTGDSVTVDELTRNVTFTYDGYFDSTDTDSFAVVATNQVGDSPKSNWTTASPFPQLIGPVTELQCVGRDFAADILWGRPDFVGDTVTQYVIELASVNYTTTAGNLSVAGLENFETLTARVWAVNDLGFSPGASCFVTPAPASIPFQDDVSQLLWNGTAPPDLGLHTAPAVCDLDADGNLDVVVGTQGDGLFVFLGSDTGGPLALHSQIAVATGGGTYLKPAAVDADGDGLVDVAVGVATGEIVLLRGNGTGALEEVLVGNPFSGVNFGAYATPSFGDLNGDGVSDLIVGVPATGEVHWCSSYGLFNLRVTVKVSIGGQQSWDFAGLSDSYITSQNGETYTYDALLLEGGVYDFNAHDSNAQGGWGEDGYYKIENLDTGAVILDETLYVAGDDDGVYITTQTSTVTLEHECGLLLEAELSDIVVTACDIDSDDDTDLIMGATEGTLSLFENTGGKFSSAWALVTNTSLATVDTGCFTMPSCLAPEAIVVGSVADGLVAYLSFAVHPGNLAPAVATAGRGAATLSWDAPSDGGTDITAYTIAAFANSNTSLPAVKTKVFAGDSTQDVTFSDLAADVPVAFTVVATNSAGDSAVSALSNEVTPLKRLEVIAVPVAGALAIEWDAPDLTVYKTTVQWQSASTSDEVTGPTGANSGAYNATDVECDEYSVTVTVATIKDGLVSETVTGIVPNFGAGICPHVCPSASGWINPLETDAFLVTCNGNWTSLLGLTAERQAVLISVSTDRVGDEVFTGDLVVTINDTAVKTPLNNRRVFFPDNFTLHLNPPAAEVRLWLDATAVLDDDYGELELLDGAHTIEVRATLWGDVGAPDSFSWTQDTTAPTPKFDTAPDLFTSSQLASFTLNADDVFSKVLELRYDLDGESVGDETLGSSATSNETEPLQANLTVTAEGAVEFALSTADATVSVDYGPWVVVADSSGDLALEPGVHVVQFAVDEDEPAAFVVPVQVATEAAPDTTVLHADINSTTATFTLSGSGEYSLDLGATWQPCGTTVQLSNLTEGAHTALFRVAGDPTPASWGWYVTRRPDTSFAVEPPALVLSTDSAVEFELACDLPAGCTEFWYSVDDGTPAAAAAGSSSVVVDLGDQVGAHVLSAWAVSEGLPDLTPAVHAWQVVEPPVISLVARPPANESEFVMAAFFVNVTGGSDCAVSSVLEDVTAQGVVATTTDGGAELLFGPLAPHEYRLTVTAACEFSVTKVVEWSFVDSAAVGFEIALADRAEGLHSASIWATDEAGNVGGPAVHEWRVDLTAPETIITSAPSGAVGTALVEMEYNCTDKSTPCEFDISPPIDVELADGLHTVTVTATDRAGWTDLDPPSASFVVDTTAPEVLIVNYTAVTSALSLTASCVDATTNCTVDGGGVVDISALPDGPANVTVVAVDFVGNQGSLTVALDVDRTAPVMTLESPIAAFTNENATAAIFDVSCADAHDCAVVIEVDGAVELAPELAEGNRTVRLWSVDVVGNSNEADDSLQLWVVVDQQPPALSFALDGYSVDGGSATVLASCQDEWPCSAHVFAATAVVAGAGAVAVAGADGTHEVCANATDAAGNWADVQCVSLLFDTVAPVVGLSFAGSGAQDLLNVTVRDANPVSCNCSATSLGVEACGPEQLWAVAIAELELQVVAEAACVDVRGHSDAASLAWTVDLVDPVVDIGFEHTHVNFAALNVSFAVADFTATTQVCELALEGVVLNSTACYEPAWQVAATAEGEYAVTITATDELGNSAAAKHSFEFDVTPPTIAVSARPVGTTQSSSADISFGCVVQTSCDESVEDDDCAFAYSLDGAAPAIEVDFRDVLELDGLAVGLHSVELTARDAAGNEADPFDIEWEVIEEAIATEILTFPAKVSGVHWATFSWTVPGADSADDDYLFAWRIDATSIESSEWTSVGHNTSVTVTLDEVDEYTFFVAVVNSETAADTYTWDVAHCEPLDEIEVVDELTGELLCEGCPEGADCVNGVASASDGWWYGGDAVIRKASTLYPCRVTEACVDQACGVGYEGALCDSCAPDYGRGVDETCGPCSSSGGAAAVLLILAMAVLAAVISAFVVKRSLRTDELNDTTALLKIIVNYLLMMGVLKDLNLDWGSMLTTLFTWMGVASGNNTTDLQFVNCVGQLDVFDLTRVYFCVPVGIVVLPAMAIWGYAGVRRLRGGVGSAKIWGHSKALVYRQSLLVLTYFAYPVVAMAACRVLNCSDVDGESRLVANYTKECSGGEYTALQATAILFVVVFAMGVPLAIFVLMRRHASELEAANSKARVQFYFFTAEYRAEWYWWEMFVMFRKLAMGAIAVTLNAPGQLMQVYTGTWILLISFSAQLAFQPHRSPLQRAMETVSQGTVLSSLLLGSGMSVLGVRPWQRDLFQWMVFGLNLLVVNSMALVLGLHLWREQKARHLKKPPASVEMAVVTLQRGGTAPPTLAQRRFTMNPMLATEAI